MAVCGHMHNWSHQVQPNKYAMTDRESLILNESVSEVELKGMSFESLHKGRDSFCHSKIIWLINRDYLR